VHLSFLVFLGSRQGTEGGAAERDEGEGICLGCGRDAFPQLVKMTEGCGKKEGRELADEG
jgi:hypothetical protein